MSARTKSPVEPLSRPAWERIEAGLFERLEQGEHLTAPSPAPPRRAPARVWVGVAALAAAAAALSWWQFWERSAPLAMHHAPEGLPAEVTRHAPRQEGTQIVTTDAPTRTMIGEAALTLAARSAVHVGGSDADGWLVRLEQGEVDCEVAPRNGRPPFIVQAGETRVTVVGTRFTVVREGSGAHVQVREGRVHISSGTTQVSIGPGEEWPPSPRALVLDELPELDEPVAEARAAARARKPERPRRTPEAGARFAQAAQLEASDPEAAIAMYRKLAAGTGHWAANALYAEARLEFELGRPRRARTLLRRYLARYPRGANVSDARVLLNRIAAGK